MNDIAIVPVNCPSAWIVLHSAHLCRKDAALLSSTLSVMRVYMCTCVCVCMYNIMHVYMCVYMCVYTQQKTSHCKSTIIIIIIIHVWVNTVCSKWDLASHTDDLYQQILHMHVVGGRAGGSGRERRVLWYIPNILSISMRAAWMRVRLPVMHPSVHRATSPCTDTGGVWNLCNKPWFT